MGGILQTAERSSHLDPSENVIFQRHLKAYKHCANLVNGTVLELGCGEGYGISELSSHTDRYIAIDKFETQIPKSTLNNVEFLKMNVPPLTGIADNSVDFVVSFQVIEHIYDDEQFVSEAYRVLRKGGKFILTTPNIYMTLSRNPWHIREYTPMQMREILQTSFFDVEVNGIFGNEIVMQYYNKNKESVQSYRKWDIFRLEKNLPRWMLRIPYDILNRYNRYSLKDKNSKLVKEIKHTDYKIEDVSDSCLDFFCIATK